MGRITISELHGYLIDERNSGALTEIPSTLYEEVHAELASLRMEALKMEDPFGEGVQSLLKERDSLREYIRDLYAERTRKIFSLSLAKATGEEINREELRAMVPGERALYEVVSDSALSCRKALLDGKATLNAATAYSYVPPDLTSSAPVLGVAGPDTDVVADISDARADEVFPEGNADAETAPESYRVIMVRDKVEEFQDYSGRIYTLSPGDIVSLPQPMAEILCNRNIALNIRLRK